MGIIRMGSSMDVVLFVRDNFDVKKFIETGNINTAYYQNLTPKVWQSMDKKVRNTH